MGLTMKRCLNCGAFNNDADFYCYNCNMKIPHSKVLTCERCGKKVNTLVYINFYGKKVCLDCFRSLHP